MSCRDKAFVVTKLVIVAAPAKGNQRFAEEGESRGKGQGKGRGKGEGGPMERVERILSEDRSVHSGIVTVPLSSPSSASFIIIVVVVFWGLHQHPLLPSSSSSLSAIIIVVTVFFGAVYHHHELGVVLLVQMGVYL